MRKGSWPHCHTQSSQPPPQVEQPVPEQMPQTPTGSPTFLCLPSQALNVTYPLTRKSKRTKMHGIAKGTRSVTVLQATLLVREIVSVPFSPAAIREDPPRVPAATRRDPPRVPTAGRRDPPWPDNPPLSATPMAWAAILLGGSHRAPSSPVHARRGPTRPANYPDSSGPGAQAVLLVAGSHRAPSGPVEDHRRSTSRLRRVTRYAGNNIVDASQTIW